MNVKAIRESKKMTQAEVAKNLNVSRTTVTMWETGESNQELKSFCNWQSFSTVLLMSC